ncbi:hypothetical protein [Methylomonas koyamae]|uniref:hypothetical protein n=1 Tax=Methylomonas koyamae TaxID=702114 RepID=UPI0012F6D1A6|nr:hypothetical protein [Methylomonas koyamae]BBL60277.1 hypothetical protein MKFW12EY_38900 [Methylomonas koyamae]
MLERFISRREDCLLSRLSQLCANQAGVYRSEAVAPMQQEVAQCVAEGCPTTIVPSD